MKMGIRACVAGLSGALIFSAAHAGVAPTDEAAEENAPPASAASAPQGSTASAPQEDTGTAEVVVTAQRKAENLQKVPIAVTALSNDQLSNAGATQIVNLSGVVPNLASRVQANGIQLYIRGIGANTGASPGDEPSVSTYIDGMYMPFGSSVAAASLPNVERVEVLKGPQGTLFGRNATAGVIQLVTSDPSRTGVTGQASLGYGNYQTVVAKAYVSGPMTSWLAGDVAVYREKQADGYGTNLAKGIDTFTNADFEVRSKLLITPTDTTEIRLIGDYHQYRSDAPEYQLAQGAISPYDHVTTYPGAYNTQGNYDPIDYLREFSASIKLDQDIGALHFSNQSTYRDFLNIVRQDYDTTPVAVLNANLNGIARVLTNETQLFGPKDSRLQWIVGAYYFDLNGGYDPFNQTGSLTGANAFVNVFTDQRIKSISGYGQATYAITDTTHLTLGLRNTAEARDLYSRTELPTKINPATGQHIDSNKWTWRFALAQDFTDALNGYVSYNRGIKSGGFSMTAPAAPGYAPEQLDAYEAGFKSLMLDHTLRLNLAAFFYHYENIQVRQGLAGSNIVTNAAAGKSSGIDLDYNWQPLARFSMSGGLGWLPIAKFTDYPSAASNVANGGASIFFDATDHRLSNAPKITASTTAQYVQPLGRSDLAFNVGVTYESYSFANADNRLQYPSHTLLNGSVTWSLNNFSVKAWMNNATDATYYTYRSPNANGDLQVQAPPRTYGVTLTQKF
jgi:iron complex outermembrane recepter protein